MNVYRRVNIGILFFGLACSSVWGQEHAGNPVFPGWYADPETAVFGHNYWVYPTYSAKYKDQVFFDAFSSRDLVHWEKHAHILDTNAVRWARRAMWAPAITKKDGKYYFFFAANDIQHDSAVGGIGVAVADRPGGPYKDYLGRPLIDKFHNGAQPIDQAIFRDKDGSWYMIYGGWRHCNIVRLKPDFTGLNPLVNLVVTYLFLITVVLLVTLGVRWVRKRWVGDARYMIWIVLPYLPKKKSSSPVRTCAVCSCTSQ